MDHVAQYIQEATRILSLLDQSAIERTTDMILELRERSGRLFLLGVGGGAGHASHAACDFRKIAQIEAYAPSDNVSELTARVNDEGWDTCYANWLRGSRLSEADMVFIFSVGGGDAKNNISTNLVRALEYAREVRATVNPSTITPHTESFQAMIWHLLVSHPKLRVAEMKWESVQSPARV